MEITEAIFTKATGRPPEQDDLERCNCKGAGTFGHSMCGWCETHGQPVFTCLECMRVNRYTIGVFPNV